MRGYILGGAFAVLATGACATVDTDPIEERCNTAQEAVSACTGSSGSSVYDACIAAESEDEAIIDELLATSCPEPSGDERDDLETLSREAFIPACSAAVLSANLVTQQRNRHTIAFSLPVKEQARLDSFLGSIAYRVKVHFHAELIDELVVLGRRYKLSNTYAQTFGNHIYIDDGYKRHDTWQRATMAHEVTHAKQAHRYGGLGGFSLQYCRAFWNAGLSYTNNSMEVSARMVADKYEACIEGTSACP